jgi:hypothetical protein
MMKLFASPSYKNAPEWKELEESATKNTSEG